MQQHHNQTTRTMPRMKRWNVVFAFGLLMALTSIAQADRKILPGSICQPWGGSPSSVRSQIGYSLFGEVYNWHTSEALGVVCPLPRNNASQAYNWVRLYYDENHPVGGTTNSLRCRLRSTSIFGDQSVYSSPEIKTNTSGGTYSGYWQFSGVASNNDSTYPSQYVMFCLIPPMYNGEVSSIGGFVIDEPN